MSIYADQGLLKVPLLKESFKNCKRSGGLLRKRFILEDQVFENKF
jgi:hypothetical protein